MNKGYYLVYLDGRVSEPLTFKDAVRIQASSYIPCEVVKVVVYYDGKLVKESDK